MNTLQSSQILKTTAKWILSIAGTYIFWMIAYFVLVKLAINEIRDLQAGGKNFVDHLNAVTIFWYVLYFLVLAVCLYVVYSLVLYAPRPQISALVSSLLIGSSATIVMIAAVKDAPIIQILPHLLINLPFLAAVLTGFKRDKHIS